MTTASDLARFARALLDGTAPGSSALDPVAPIPGGQIGLLWHVLEVDGRTITWHNGMTGGYASFVGWDPSSGRGLALLSDTARSLDELAVGVLTGAVEL